MAAWFLGDVTGMVVSILILMQNSEGCVAGAPGPVPDRVIGAPSSWAIVGRLMPRLRPLVAPPGGARLWLARQVPALWIGDFGFVPCATWGSKRWSAHRATLSNLENLDLC